MPIELPRLGSLQAPPPPEKAADGTINGRPTVQQVQANPARFPSEAAAMAELDRQFRREAKRVADAVRSPGHRGRAPRMATNSRSGPRRTSSPARSGQDPGDPDLDDDEPPGDRRPLIGRRR